MVDEFEKKLVSKNVKRLVESAQIATTLVAKIDLGHSSVFDYDPHACLYEATDILRYLEDLQDSIQQMDADTQALGGLIHSIISQQS